MLGSAQAHAGVCLYIVAFLQHLTRGLLQSASIEGVYSLPTLELNIGREIMKLGLYTLVHRFHIF